MTGAFEGEWVYNYDLHFHVLLSPNERVPIGSMCTQGVDKELLLAQSQKPGSLIYSCIYGVAQKNDPYVLFRTPGRNGIWLDSATSMYNYG